LGKQRHALRATYASSAPAETPRVGDSDGYANFDFRLTGASKTSKARTAVITTPHGDIETPNFVFCATKAAMKAMTPAQLREANSQIILSNTYHLMLTPGADIVEKMGGLQKFTGWNGPMLTDSGGYQ
jgi:queuine tRNA-ribosyltransferase